MLSIVRPLIALFSCFVLISACSLCFVSAEEKTPSESDQTTTSHGGCHDESAGDSDSTKSKGEGHLFCCDTSILPENYARIGFVKWELVSELITKTLSTENDSIEHRIHGAPWFNISPSEPISYLADLSISPNAPPSRV